MDGLPAGDAPEDRATPLDRRWSCRPRTCNPWTPTRRSCRTGPTAGWRSAPALRRRDSPVVELTEDFEVVDSVRLSQFLVTDPRRATHVACVDRWTGAADARSRTSDGGAARRGTDWSAGGRPLVGPSTAWRPAVLYQTTDPNGRSRRSASSHADGDGPSSTACPSRPIAAHPRRAWSPARPGPTPTTAAASASSTRPSAARRSGRPATTPAAVQPGRPVRASRSDPYQSGPGPASRVRARRRAPATVVATSSRTDASQIALTRPWPGSPTTRSSAIVNEGADQAIAAVRRRRRLARGGPQTGSTATRWRPGLLPRRATGDAG